MKVVLERLRRLCIRSAAREADRKIDGGLVTAALPEVSKSGGDSESTAHAKWLSSNVESDWNDVGVAL